MDRITLVDCKRELRKRNADTRGSKAALIDRLRTLLENEGSDIETLMSQIEESASSKNVEQNLGGDESSQIVRPEDSVSQHTRRSHRSGSSHTSSVRVTRAMEAARKAGLLAKAKILEKSREKEKDELRLRQEREKLDIEAEIEEAAAREKVLSDFESEEGRKSQVGSVHSLQDLSRPTLSAEATTFHPKSGKDSVTVGHVPQSSLYEPMQEYGNSSVGKVQDLFPQTGVTSQQPNACSVDNDRSFAPHRSRFGALLDEPRISNTPEVEYNYVNLPSTPLEPYHANQGLAGEQSVRQVNFLSPNTSGYSKPQENSESPTRIEMNDKSVGIMETLVSYNLKSLMPKVEIQSFSGDYTRYRSFIRSFESIISSKLSSEEEKLYYLEQFTTGEPQEVVRACLHMAPEVGYQEARRLLQNKYGRQERIASAYIDKIANWPTMTPNDVQSLNKFAIMLETCKNAFMNVPLGSREIEHPKTIRAIMEKLPNYMQDRWRRLVDTIEENECRGVCFKDLVDYVSKEARILSNPLYGKHLMGSQPSNKQRKSEEKSKTPVRRGQAVAKVNLNVTDKLQKPLKCFYCNENHHLNDCITLTSKPEQERKDFVMKKGLCFGCLRNGHRSKDCKRRITCRICKSLHPTILHRYTTERVENKIDSRKKENPNLAQKKGQDEGKRDAEPTPKVSVGVLSHLGKDSEQRMCIIPVKVRAIGGNLVPTYAFLDNGSTASFCTTNLLQKLSLRTIGSAQLSVSTIQPEGMVMKSYIVPGVDICDAEENNFIRLPPLYTIDKIPVTKDDMTRNEHLKEWPHLQSIDIPEFDAEVGLMIGNDVPQATEPWEVINSPQEGAPFAIKTKLGWVVCGSSAKEMQSTVKINKVKINDMSVDQMLENLYNQEFKDLNSTKKGLSEEDRQWVRLTEQSCIQRSDGHYEIALPFREDTPDLANNRCIARKRLENLKIKFLKDPAYFAKYSEFMEELFKKGHAEPVTEPTEDSEAQGLWYMPHHGVFHPQKLEKLRVVFDCASRFKGSSLNDHLLQGPDLANSLVDVLIGFRCGSVAFIADIESMFYQVKVPPRDREFLRFLWYPHGNIDAELKEYRMTVHVFGANSSPSCANFALRKTAEDYGKEHMQESQHTIMKNFYIDDCLRSASNETEAIKIAHDVKELCRKGGFNLTKYSSNSRNLLQSFLPEYQSKRVKDLDLCRDRLPAEKALGMCWDVESDSLKIAVNVRERPSTKRGVLSTIGAMYDPLGIVSPSILRGRMILQEICRQKRGWDEEISEQHKIEWESWKDSLSDLQNIELARCITPNEFSARSCKLHHFSDASEKGYGIVTYLRIEGEGKINCVFMFGKSRVAPLKTVTIPRLELMAATTAVKVNNMIVNALEFEVGQSIFWTDSTTVLKYIRNDRARFHTFVANRLAVIKDGSQKEQWRYVESSNNPADDASRGYQTDRWLKGPEFLLKDEHEWPIEPLQSITSLTDLEIKAHVTVNKSMTKDSPTHKLIHYFSEWHKLKKAVAWLLHLKSRLIVQQKEVSPAKYLSVKDMTEAEKSILLLVQREMFDQEITALEDTQKIKLHGPISSLKPMLQDGLLRVGGRICNAPLSYESIHPIILPYKHHVTDLIIKGYHENYGHVGRQHVLSLLRERFWIVKGSAAVRRVLRKCVKCRKIQAPVMQQQMADLPSDRVTPGEPPFTRTGVDCFGPFYTKRGRAQVKRYGVLFTCLVTRAIHIEVADSLSTDSFINALRRFIARRGQVNVIRSDRGTNFVGAEKELKDAMNAWNENRIHDTLLLKGVDWSFNPPYASHFGGVWERMIRSVRKVLNGIMKEQVLNDDSLATLLCEVEAIVNSRPLTTVTADSHDLLPLTPNHLLTLRGACMNVGEFDNKDTYSKKRWRHVQYLADLFWKRWRREYLSSLQERKKWSTVKCDLKKGDIVLVVDEAVPRCHWPLGRIVEVFSSTDGLTRSAKIKCEKGIIDRPLAKLVLLYDISVDN